VRRGKASGKIGCAQQYGSFNDIGFTPSVTPDSNNVSQAVEIQGISQFDDFFTTLPR
jgi:hypothetical protein